MDGGTGRTGAEFRGQRATKFRPPKSNLVTRYEITVASIREPKLENRRPRDEISAAERARLTYQLLRFVSSVPCEPRDASSARVRAARGHAGGHTTRACAGVGWSWRAWTGAGHGHGHSPTAGDLRIVLAAASRLQCPGRHLSLYG